MAATDPVSITLSAQQWEVVMQAMAEAPYRIVARLINEIDQQKRRATESAPESLNGAEHRDGTRAERPGKSPPE